MTEDELQERLMCSAARRGLLAHHCRDSRLCQGAPGFPDTVIVGPGGVAFVEVKSSEGLVSLDQAQWLNLLQRDGHQAGMVRPEHWHSGEIAAVLGRLAGD